MLQDGECEVDGNLGRGRRDRVRLHLHVAAGLRGHRKSDPLETEKKHCLCAFHAECYALATRNIRELVHPVPDGRSLSFLGTSARAHHGQTQSRAA